MADWIGVLVGITGLGFALYEHRQRTRVEDIVRDTLRRLAGDVEVIYSNAYWADLHFRNIGYRLTEREADVMAIKKEVLDGARDAAACARQLGLAHSRIRGIQGSFFHDSERILPEIQSDDVREAQRKLDERRSAEIPQKAS
jgi:hypothetical protein